MRTHYIDGWLAWRGKQLLWEAASEEIALAQEHTMRQGGRLPGRSGSRRSLPSQWPESLTDMARGGADSKRVISRR